MRCQTLTTFFFTCSAALCVGQVNNLGEVVVTARRPMKEIGVSQTVLDSTVLKENMAQSLADVLAFNTPVFVKNAGRATLSTVAFRGTGPGHTQVSWNGLRINSPMVGMTDFSAIPAYFVDAATLLHGTSAVTETGGGLGGMVRLANKPDAPMGVALKYIQGVGSFTTFDEFLRLSYADSTWTTSTRVAFSSSPNDFHYINHDKKENIYDSDHNIISQYHPREKNRSGEYKDLQVLQEVYYNAGRRNRMGLNAWYVNTNRQLPVTTTDYGNSNAFDNRQREQTVRAVASWAHFRNTWRCVMRGGYVYTWLAYDYKRETAPGFWSTMTHSRSTVNTAYMQADADYNPNECWYFTANASMHRHRVSSADRTIATSDGDKANIGYHKGRTEVSAAVSAKWQPTPKVGLSAVARQELYGGKGAFIPAMFCDIVLCQRYNVLAKASVSRNHRFPTLNDLYFMPGGNPELKNEKGFTYDVGVSATVAKAACHTVDASATWFDSYISDWILWLPTTKGFFSPRNVKKVHSYGVEGRLNYTWQIATDVRLNISGTYAWTPSLNKGDAMSWADMSIGKQLPYVPRHSATVNSRLSWKSWGLLYQWCYCSKRYTMSSNEDIPGGVLPKYYISNVAVSKDFQFKPMDLQLKLNINNLFNRDYQTIMSHPMPGVNYEFFVAITPRL